LSYRLDRFEMKFVITREQRDALMPSLLPHLRADANAGDNAFYPIISLYYDNPDRDCYWEKIRGQKSRRKLRVRVYGSLDGKVPPTSFIEIKHKCDSRVVKRRAQMPLEAALTVGEGKNVDVPLNFASEKVIIEAHKMVHERGFRPFCCMRYDRQAFADVNPASDLRITFDTGIGFRMDDLTPVPDDRNFSHYLLRQGESVMELKVTGSVPYWLPRMLGDVGCILTSHSKYCNALEAGDPALQWKRDRQAALAAQAVLDVTPSSDSEAATAFA
jgi:SPX domain protein involved in polyphosphate accumulation